MLRQLFLRSCVGFAVPLCAFSGTAWSADLASLVEARAVADAAVAQFQAENFSEGYGGLKPYWPVSAGEFDALTGQTIDQWPIVRQQFGTSIGAEFVSDTRIGQSFAQFIYLHKFDNHAIRWIFTFYKPRDRWILNGVSFDDSIDLLFQPQ